MITAAAQKPAPGKPAPTPKTKETKEKEAKEKEDAWAFPSTPKPPTRYPRSYEAEQTTEKFIAVDPNVSIKMCVTDSNVKVNGWERNEVRVFVRSGRLPGFKVLEKDHKSGKANWLLVTNIRPEGARPGPMSECLTGEEIELDVPMGSGLSLTGRAANTVIDSINKVSVKTADGHISLKSIPGGIAASTYQGNLEVVNSGGAIALETTTGNITAFDVNPGQIGDLFKAKSNGGNVSLQQVEHRQIEASSITGSVNFNGKFLPGGLYNFKTSNGTIRMVIPLKTSATIKANYGFGSFNSEIPLKFIYVSKTEGGQNFQALIGTGEANINLTTNTGVIAIKKL
jgi:hypothetical protein